MSPRHDARMSVEGSFSIAQFSTFRQLRKFEEVRLLGPFLGICWVHDEILCESVSREGSVERSKERIREV